MGMETIFLVGASGHGKVVLDALLKRGVLADHIIVTDDSVELRDKYFLGLPIQTPAIQASAFNASFHIAIGNSRVRRRVFQDLERAGSKAFTIFHPLAAVSQFASVGAGTFVAAHGVVAPGATIGRGAIINHGAIIDHDCLVGDFAHIAPNATLGGGVHIGELALVGAGATILPRTTVGEGAIIGAGAVVLHDVKAGEICVGVPAVSTSGR